LSSALCRAPLWSRSTSSRIICTNIRMQRGICVQTRIAMRRVQRHPTTRRAVRHVVRGTGAGLIPSALNDVVFHHAQIDVGEVVHVVQDSLAVSILNIAIHIATKLLV
jgi:hypothetical protein